jgi:WD40 repeat protein
MKQRSFLAVLLCLALLTCLQIASAQGGIAQICPSTGIQARGATFTPGGIILTAFDKSAIWLYNVDNGQRYPLPETMPCGSNCHLSPDATSITFFNDPTNTFNIMRLNGTERALVSLNAAEVSWWNPSTYLIWTPGKDAYLQPIAGGDPEHLDVKGVISVQPNGRYGVRVDPKDDGFERSLVNLQDRNSPRVTLGADQSYFNASAWSRDGRWLAYVAAVNVDGLTGGEIFGIKPGDPAPTQWTHLSQVYGAARINGMAVGELSWSPDGTRIAFWVSEITGADPSANVGSALIHILDVNSGAVSFYCGYSTTEQTPNPSRLVWSPDGTHLAFGGTVPNGELGYHLLAMDVATGAITSLSVGIVPIFGAPDVLVWGSG